METSRNYNIDKGKGNGVEHIKKKFFFIKSKNFNNIPLHFVMVAGSVSQQKNSIDSFMLEIWPCSTTGNLRKTLL